MVIFHSYVSLPEGNSVFIQQETSATKTHKTAVPQVHLDLLGGTVKDMLVELEEACKNEHGFEVWWLI